MILVGRQHAVNVTTALTSCNLESLMVQLVVTTHLEMLHYKIYFAEKAMVTHSSVLAWRIPGTGEPGGLLSMGSHRIGHD